MVLTVHSNLLHVMSSVRSHELVHTEGLRYLKNSTPGVPSTCVTLFHWSMSVFSVKNVMSLRANKMHSNSIQLVIFRVTDHIFHGEYFYSFTNTSKYCNKTLKTQNHLPLTDHMTNKKNISIINQTSTHFNL